MDESGIDMGYDLAALSNEDFELEYNNDFEQALSMLSTSQDFMYYELKSRAPDTGRFVSCVLTIYTNIYFFFILLMYFNAFIRDGFSRF